MHNNLFRGNTDWKSHPGTITTICLSYFTTRGCGKDTEELTIYHQLEELSKGQKETPHVLPTSQNPSHWNPSWLNNVCTTRKDPESERLAKENPETNHIMIKSRLRATWQTSSPRFLYPPALHWVSLLNKISCFVSTCVSLKNSFLNVRQEPVLGS